MRAYDGEKLLNLPGNEARRCEFVKVLNKQSSKYGVKKDTTDIIALCNEILNWMCTDRNEDFDHVRQKGPIQDQEVQ